MRIKPLEYCVYYRKRTSEPLFESKEHLKEFKMIKNPPFYWCADPFLLVIENKVYVFAEICNRITNKGHIGFFEISNKKAKWKKCLQAQSHLSFPNVFQYNNCFYMIPESCQNKTVSLYSLENFNNIKWVLADTIINNVSYVDSIFEQSRMLLACYQEKKLELHFYSLSDFFNPTPVFKIVDFSKQLRPAGNFIKYKNKDILPTQDCSAIYGGGIIFNFFTSDNRLDSFLKIDKNDVRMWLSVNSCIGIHTYNCFGDYEVIDIQKTTFNIYSFFGRFLRIFKRIKQRQS